ncbi:MAG: PEP-CTERM sorting domain-containing protein [Chthoniobacterales bacterium]|nr:PEP-CTERM sorting domain-containing protein [Chthoniobacterales bacterium]
MEVLEDISPRAAARDRVPQSGNSGVWVFMLLAVVGLGGGLFLAFFSSGSPTESPTRIASVAREVLYARPVLTALPAEVAEMREIGAAESPGGGVATTHQSATAHHGAESPEAFSSASVSLSNLPADHPLVADAWGFGADAGKMMAAASIATSLSEIAGGPGGTEHASQALTAAPVPEPSTWALLLAGAGGLWALRRRQAGTSL